MWLSLKWPAHEGRSTSQDASYTFFFSSRVIHVFFVFFLATPSSFLPLSPHTFLFSLCLRFHPHLIFHLLTSFLSIPWLYSPCIYIKKDRQKGFVCGQRGKQAHRAHRGTPPLKNLSPLLQLKIAIHHFFFLSFCASKLNFSTIFTCRLVMQCSPSQPVEHGNCQHEY